MYSIGDLVPTAIRIIIYHQCGINTVNWYILFFQSVTILLKTNKFIITTNIYCVFTYYMPEAGSSTLNISN